MVKRLEEPLAARVALVAINAAIGSASDVDAGVIHRRCKVVLPLLIKDAAPLLRSIRAIQRNDVRSLARAVLHLVDDAAAMPGGRVDAARPRVAFAPGFAARAGIQSDQCGTGGIRTHEHTITGHGHLACAAARLAGPRLAEGGGSDQHWLETRVVRTHAECWPIQTCWPRKLEGDHRLSGDQASIPDRVLKARAAGYKAARRGEVDTSIGGGGDTALIGLREGNDGQVLAIRIAIIELREIGGQTLARTDGDDVVDGDRCVVHRRDVHGDCRTGRGRIAIVGAESEVANAGTVGVRRRPINDAALSIGHQHRHLGDGGSRCHTVECLEERSLGGQGVHQELKRAGVDACQCNGKRCILERGDRGRSGDRDGIVSIEGAIAPDGAVR